MKKSIYINLFALSILLTSAVTGKYINKPDIYNQWLSPILNLDSLHQFKTEMAAIKSGPDKFSKQSILSKPSDSWNLIGYQYQGWEKYFPHEKINIDENFICKDRTMIFTTAEILKTFKIRDSINGKKYTVPCDYFPIVLESASLFDGIWSATIYDNTYLMIRNAYVYPHGNTTSWCKEWIYYFKKVNVD